MIVLYILLALIVFVAAIVFIGGLFAPRKYDVRREIIINRPASEVYDYVRHLVNQEQFSVWVMRDPDMKKTFTGTDGETGFIYAWEGNPKAGKGEQEIIDLTPYSRVDVEVRFEKPFKTIAKTPFILEDQGENSTKVTWIMDSGMNYPMNSMLLIMKPDKMLGADLEISLGNLKRILENQ